jgi:hypothetical protein
LIVHVTSPVAASAMMRCELNVVWDDLISSLPVHVDQGLLVQRTLHDAAEALELRLARC